MGLVGMKVSIKCNLGECCKWDCTTTRLTTNQTRGELIARRGCWRTHGIGRSRWTGLVALQLGQSTAMQIVLGPLLELQTCSSAGCQRSRLCRNRSLRRLSAEFFFAGTCCYKIVQLSMARRHFSANHEESRTESASHVFCMFLLVVAAPPKSHRQREREMIESLPHF